MPDSVSVIVPLHRRTPAFEQCVAATLKQLGDRHEMVVVSDADQGPLPDGVRVVLTGSSTDTSPAEKRDAALATVNGSICAFLDDDAYPAPGWIDRALERFADPQVAAVGGPGVTPPGSGWRERAGGAFYESPLGSGGLRYRFTPLGDVRDVDDYPAYNFFVRSDALRDVGGWASKFYGGEDTKVCLALHQGGHRIVYDPEVLVYHHRRPVFAAHCRQVANVGRHRGNFVRTFPETSRRPIYFAPSAALLGGAAVVLWSARSRRRAARLAVLSAAGGAAIAAGALRDGHDLAAAATLPAVLVAGHAAYGAAFLQGLCTGEIESM